MFLLPSTKSSETRSQRNPATQAAAIDPVVVRHSTSEDAARIGTLARLDDIRLPAGPYLVAEVGGEVTAAVSIPTGRVLADPFRRTADEADILRLRSSQLAA
jgi:hypothetical protein